MWPIEKKSRLEDKIKKYVESILMCMTFFWNNIHQVHSNSIDWKAKSFLKSLGAIK